MNEKRRGRPRGYDPETALGAALEAFWRQGFSGTSLDQISTATGMNRPSLYAAFGDKKAIYRKAVEQFNRDFLGRLKAALFADEGIAADLAGFYLAALPTYRSGEGVAKGCPVICTATVEAAVDDDIQADLARALDCIDEALTARFALARDRGELSGAAEPAKLGRMAGALLHSLAVRVRARQSGFEPELFIEESVAAILAGHRA